MWKEIRELAAEVTESRPNRISTAGPGELGLAVCDLNGKITAVNAVWSQLLGYPDGELRGRSLAEIAPGEEREQVAELIGQLRDGEIYTLCRVLGNRRLPDPV